MKIKLPASTQNWISLIGATIALISFFMIVFLFTVTMILDETGSYFGLVIYILLPAVMIAGLILIPIGMYLQRKKQIGAVGEWPRIDLNDEKYRNAFFIFTIGTTILLFLSAVGSYEAFHYTESVEFCGTTCHSVMHPEYIAYQNSAHARVSCVDCHVGSGADWYVRSKLSGLYQVYATIANVYPKPIPTPIQNLRPARETCERCHWPQKFYPQKLQLQRHFLSDQENSEWDIQMIMKIGSEFAAHGLKEGIHWHINPNVKVEYISSDESKDEIPWVRLTNLETGKTTIYQDEYNPLEKDINEYEIYTMDCMDCHNRPSHNYSPPAFFVNEAMTAGDIPDELPDIKYLTMQICEEEFSSTDSAMAYISSYIEDYYKSDYPDLFDNNREMIDQAIRSFQTVYAQNIFPEMKVTWDAYPNHIGHVEFDGCFRCHTDLHVSENDEFIRKDCNLCHTISAQGPVDEMEIAQVGQSLEFRHPIDIDEMWKEGVCTDCHTGLNP